MDAQSLLSDFLYFQKTKSDLTAAFGNDLHNVSTTPVIVSRDAAVFAIDVYLSGKITKNQLVDWVNVLWFTDLFEYADEDADSIASVMDVLETLDEEGAEFSTEDFQRMKECLLNNEEY